MTTLENDLKAAREELKALQAELPDFEKLLAENEVELGTLKGTKNLDALTQAKGRVNVARELLEQHHADIATAQSKVNRLEEQLAREQRLEEMTQHAKRALEHKDTFDHLLSTTNEALAGHVKRLLEVYDGLTAERQAFLELARDASLQREATARGISLVRGPEPYKSYPYPEPHGGFLWEQVYNVLVRRRCTATRTRARRAGAAQAGPCGAGTGRHTA